VIRLKPDDATAYNNRANLYARKGQHDHAIADFNEATRLRPDYPEAYFGRGLSYNHLAQFDRAIADYDQAIHLKPDYAEVYISRGYSHSLKGEHDVALPDFAAAIKLKPDALYAYYDRALTELVLGHYDHAAEDLQRAVGLDSSSAYLVAWLHVARAKSAVDDRDEFARNAARIDSTRWPSPVMALYLGRATPEQLQAAAGYNDPQVAEDRDCFAAIQIGEYNLMQKDAGAAKAALKHAAAACPAIFMARSIALADLRRMGQ
jgi:lipoprotein NlpI